MVVNSAPVTVTPVVSSLVVFGAPFVSPLASLVVDCCAGAEILISGVALPDAASISTVGFVA
jgi:hypothetical protein